jgi:hypothetical protein
LAAYFLAEFPHRGLECSHLALPDLILARTGWEGISNLGETQEGIDLEAENPTAAEIAFVQVKSTANQKVLDDYGERFSKRRERHARMIFAVHSPSGKLTVSSGIPVQLWTGQRVSWYGSV